MTVLQGSGLSSCEHAIMYIYGRSDVIKSIPGSKCTLPASSCHMQTSSRTPNNAKHSSDTVLPVQHAVLGGARELGTHWSISTSLGVVVSSTKPEISASPNLPSNTTTGSSYDFTTTTAGASLAWTQQAPNSIDDMPYALTLCVLRCTSLHPSPKHAHDTCVTASVLATYGAACFNIQSKLSQAHSVLRALICRSKT